MRTTLILLAVLAFQSVSFANSSDESKAYQGALNARNEFVRALTTKDFTQVTHHGFDVLMREFADSIAQDQKDPELANELINQWTTSSAMFETALFTMNALGDHNPLFPWIETFLQKMAAKYGTIIYKLQIVINVQTLNFAIPVVFTPRGNWHLSTGDNRIEYRKHFIPFANIVTYYTALYGCNYVVAHQGQPQLKKICKPAAEKLRFVMGRYIAPVVSDWIYKAGNKQLQIGSDRLRYTTPAELAQAIQQ